MKSPVTPMSRNFKIAFLPRKTREGAFNQAKANATDARMRGDIAGAVKQDKTKQEVAKVHAATAVLEIKARTRRP